jgi:hypothetical protein
MSAFQALESRRDDITIGQLILKYQNPEGVALFFAIIKIFRTLMVKTQAAAKIGATIEAMYLRQRRSDPRNFTF